MEGRRIHPAASATSLGSGSADGGSWLPEVYVEGHNPAAQPELPAITPPEGPAPPAG